MARRRSAACVEGLVVILTVLLFANIAVQAAAAASPSPPPPPRPPPPPPLAKKPPPPPLARKQPPPPPVLTQEQIGTEPIKVGAAVKTSTGATKGDIPIGYVGTSVDRSGHYYLPKGYQLKRLPVLVMLHGSGVDGNYIVSHYQSLADKYKFIIIAPDSHRQLYWYSPDKASDPFTEDYWHILACYKYVQKLKNVLFDYNHISIGGNSRGGYSGVSLASLTGIATHAMCTHSNFLWQQMGTHVIPIWVSTGASDPLFSPATMRNHLAYFHSKLPKFKYTMKVFTGGHSVGHPDELEASIKWWLSTPGATSSKTYNGFGRRR